MGMDNFWSFIRHAPGAREVSKVVRSVGLPDPAFKQKAPPVSRPSVPTSEQAAEEERQRLRRARRASTVLTGPLGAVLGPVSTPSLVGRTSLLGG
jgi:hypothetical protein